MSEMFLQTTGTIEDARELRDKYAAMLRELKLTSTRSVRIKRGYDRQGEYFTLLLVMRGEA